MQTDSPIRRSWLAFFFEISSMMRSHAIAILIDFVSFCSFIVSMYTACRSRWEVLLAFLSCEDSFLYVQIYFRVFDFWCTHVVERWHAGVPTLREKIVNISQYCMWNGTGRSVLASVDDSSFSGLNKYEKVIWTRGQILEILIFSHVYLHHSSLQNHKVEVF